MIYWFITGLLLVTHFPIFTVFHMGESGKNLFIYLLILHFMISYHFGYYCPSLLGSHLGPSLAFLVGRPSWICPVGQSIAIWCLAAHPAYPFCLWLVWLRTLCILLLWQLVSCLFWQLVSCLVAILDCLFVSSMAYHCLLPTSFVSG